MSYKIVIIDEAKYDNLIVIKAIYHSSRNSKLNLF